MSRRKKAIAASLMTKKIPKNTMKIITTNELRWSSSALGQRIRLISVNIPERLNHFIICSPPTLFLYVRSADYNAYKTSLIPSVLSHYFYYEKWCSFDSNILCTLK